MLRNRINLDITNKCALKCPMCRRQRPDFKSGGKEITLESMEKICKSFDHIIFSGNSSDPIYHTNFINILRLCDNNTVNVNTNGHGKTDEFWDEAIKVSKKHIMWTFGIDGLPKDSHKYRVGQDGEAVFEVMKRMAAAGVHVRWQYIVFKYNENDMEEARKLAKQYNLDLFFFVDSRWKYLSIQDEEIEKLRPSEKFMEFMNV